MLKKVILSAAAYLLHFSAGYADVDISKYALGVSNKSLHNQLVDDGFYFSYFDAEKISAVKYALVGRVPSEYGSIQPSTTLEGRFCNGKLYKLDFTSLYQADQTSLFFGRKGVYQYLSDKGNFVCKLFVVSYFSPFVIIDILNINFNFHAIRSKLSRCNKNSKFDSFIFYFRIFIPSS